MADLTASANSLKKGSLMVHPNPVSHWLNVQWAQKEVGTNYQLVNHIGDVVAIGKIENTQMSLDLSGLSSGIYILNTASSNTKLQVIR